jgi:glycosyltransferase involved in cell wall biosynthesis
LKVAILGPAPPYRGGISLFALMLARAWRDSGHEVAFFNFKNQYPQLLFPGKNQFDNSLDASEFPNYRILTPWLPHSWLQTAKAINDFNADLVVVSWFLPFFAPAYGAILRCLPKIRKVVLAHNVSAHEKWALADILMQFVFVKADNIVVLSNATLNELKNKMPLNISKAGILGFHPIYNCYSTSNNSRADKTYNLLFFGLIKPYKGLDVLIDAMPMVLSEFPDTKLVIAGEVYGDSNIYQKQIDELGLRSVVETNFRYISDPEISEFFSQTDLCVLPYKSASQSGVIATSYSFGVPVLASDIGGLGEYVIPGETGSLVKPKDPVKLAEGILSHFKQNTDMRPAILQYNKHHSWNALADLIAHKPAPASSKQFSKLLLITYYFPPCGGAAVQRWLRFINALERRGVKVTVITTKHGDYPHKDESLLRKLSPQLKVLRSRPLSFETLWSKLGQKELPYGSLTSKKGDSQLKKSLYWLRLNLVVPDMRIGWNKGAYKLAVEELKRDSYDIVFTSGPPHSTHLIGYKLKQKYGINWCTDFRDPWSDIYYLKLNPPSKVTMMLHKYLERRIVSSANCNYIVSRNISEALPEGNKKILYNGFEPADFVGLSYQKSDKFRIKFVGQLTAGQDVMPLLGALTELKSLTKLEFSLIGTRDFPATDVPLRRMPFLPHHEALKELVNAELLVLIINDYDGNKGMLTTKLFEYIASRSPILCLAMPGGEAEEIILKSQSGVVLQAMPDIAIHIASLYRDWLNGVDTRNTADISFLDVNRQIDCILQS